MPYYNSLRPKTVIDVFNSPSCALSVIGKEYGDAHLRAFLVKVINDLLDYFSIGKSMGAIQVAQTADLIIEEYYYLKPDDFKLCFSRAKRGKYGKVYDRIDGQVIFDWLNEYNKERAMEAESISINEADKYKNDPYTRTSESNAINEHLFRLHKIKKQLKK